MKFYLSNKQQKVHLLLILIFAANAIVIGLNKVKLAHLI